MLRSAVLVLLLCTTAAAAEPHLYVEVGSAGKTNEAARGATVRALGKWRKVVSLGSGLDSSHAFYIDPEVTKVERKGGELRCSVSLLLSTQRRINPFAIAQGSVVVSNAGGFSDADCVSAAVESLVDSDVMPALEKRAAMNPTGPRRPHHGGQVLARN
jgi:hypothetical protein